MPWRYSHHAAHARFWAHVRLIVTFAVIWMLVELFAAGVVLATFGPIVHDAWANIAEALRNE